MVVMEDSALSSERVRWEPDWNVYAAIRRAKERAELREEDEDDSIKPEATDCHDSTDD